MDEQQRQQLHELAQKLTEAVNADPDFRRLLATDPKKALGQLGFEISDEQAQIIRECFAVSLLEAASEGGVIIPFVFPH